MNEKVAADTIEGLVQDNERLRKALEKYADCRHGQIYCNCVTEARAALFPYLRKERLLKVDSARVALKR